MFRIRKIRNEDAYSVKNSETGKVHSKHTTKKLAKAQVRLLENIGGMGNKASQHMKEQAINEEARQLYEAHQARQAQAELDARMRGDEQKERARKKKEKTLERQKERDLAERKERELSAERKEAIKHDKAMKQMAEFADKSSKKETLKEIEKMQKEFRAFKKDKAQREKDNADFAPSAEILRSIRPVQAQFIDEAIHYAGPPMSSPMRSRFDPAEFRLQPKTTVNQTPDDIRLNRREIPLMSQEDKLSKQLRGSGVRKVRGQESYSFVHNGNKYAHPSRRQAKKHLKLLGGMQVPDDDEQDAQDQPTEQEEEINLTERVNSHLVGVVDDRTIDTILYDIYENQDELPAVNAMNDMELGIFLQQKIHEMDESDMDYVKQQLRLFGIRSENVINSGLKTLLKEYTLDEIKEWKKNKILTKMRDAVKKNPKKRRSEDAQLEEIRTHIDDSQAEDFYDYLITQEGLDVDAVLRNPELLGQAYIRFAKKMKVPLRYKGGKVGGVLPTALHPNLNNFFEYLTEFQRPLVRRIIRIRDEEFDPETILLFRTLPETYDAMDPNDRPPENEYIQLLQIKHDLERQYDEWTALTGSIH